uniref:GH07323p (inferred by orthology to a D. melanogaster protein) n=1 Tax=Strongyloides venezuelensis TaxID=75913 RepID=A0A0K0F0W5_STRVS
MISSDDISTKEKNKFLLLIEKIFHRGEVNVFICFWFIALALYVYVVSVFYRDVVNPYNNNDFESMANSTGDLEDLTNSEYYKDSVVTLLCFLCFSLVASRIASKLFIPGFIGSVVIGMLMQNVDWLKHTFVVHPYFIEVIRLLSAVLIVGRTSVNLNHNELKKYWQKSFMLSIPPTFLNCVWLTILTRFIFSIPLEIAFCYAFVIGVTAPPVTFTMAGYLINKKLGESNDIGKIWRVGTSLDNIFCIALLNVVMDFSFEPNGNSFLFTFLHIGVGICIGIVLGIFLWYYPSKKGMSLFTTTRVAMFFTGYGAMLFYFKTIGWYGTAGIAILISAYIVGTKYRRDAPTGTKPLEQVYLDNIWALFFEPMLFIFIGYNFNIREYDWLLIGKALIIIVSSVGLKILFALISTSLLKLNIREKLFLSLGFIPRSSIQVANSLMIMNLSQNHINSLIPIESKKFYCTMVLSLLICSTFSQWLYRYLGKKLLRRSEVYNVHIRQITIGDIKEKF